MCGRDIHRCVCTSKMHMQSQFPVEPLVKAHLFAKEKKKNFNLKKKKKKLKKINNLKKKK